MLKTFDLEKRSIQFLFQTSKIVLIVVLVDDHCHVLSVALSLSFPASVGDWSTPPGTILDEGGRRSRRRWNRGGGGRGPRRHCGIGGRDGWRGRCGCLVLFHELVNVFKLYWPLRVVQELSQVVSIVVWRITFCMICRGEYRGLVSVDGIVFEKVFYFGGNFSGRKMVPFKYKLEMEVDNLLSGIRVLA